MELQQQTCWRASPLGLKLGCCVYYIHGGPHLSDSHGVSMEAPHKALAQGQVTCCPAARCRYLCPRMWGSSVGSRPSPDSGILP